MRWTLNVNQKQSLSLGIKNINQSIILGLICECHSWAEAVLIDGQVFYWTSRQSFAKELPLLDLKPDTIYRHLKSLEELGLIEYKKDGKKDCVRLTKLGKSYYVGNESEFSENSEMNPTKLGNESENNSEMNPTYPNTNIYPITILKEDGINEIALNEWFEYKGKKFSKQGKTLVINFLKEYREDQQLQIVRTSIMNNWKGLFPPKHKQSEQRMDISKLPEGVSLQDMLDEAGRQWEREQEQKQIGGVR